MKKPGFNKPKTSKSILRTFTSLNTKSVENYSMTDSDAYYIGNLILNGAGDGQSPQALSLIPLPRRIITPNYARMQIRRLEIVRNFVAQQIEAIPENTIAQRLIQLDRNENDESDDRSRSSRERRNRDAQQLRGRGTGLRRRAASAIRRNSRRRIRRRSMTRPRIRSLSPTNSSILQTAIEVSQNRSMHENNDENLRR
ncbi:unnamed protein product [Brugia pahangi]|uniref:Uncharacterized protein n=1 Tax=Brugia pahangi TaxID=6280 RepID=A0A0N4T6L3_BRUPA|nr:unnamed protein product [Brugia pahangi]